MSNFILSTRLSCRVIRVHHIISCCTPQCVRSRASAAACRHAAARNRQAPKGGTAAAPGHHLSEFGAGVALPAACKPQRPGGHSGGTRDRPGRGWAQWARLACIACDAPQGWVAGHSRTRRLPGRAPPCMPTPLTGVQVMPRMPSLLSALATKGVRQGLRGRAACKAVG